MNGTIIANVMGQVTRENGGTSSFMETLVLQKTDSGFIVLNQLFIELGYFLEQIEAFDILSQIEVQTDPSPPRNTEKKIKDPLKNKSLSTIVQN